MNSSGLTWIEVGSLRAAIDPGSGMLRNLTIGRTLLLQGIYGAVRDQNWDTIEPEITEWDSQVEPSLARFIFTAECRRDPVHFRWEGVIELTSHELSYHFRGEVLSEFCRNRIGLCVQHPIEFADMKYCARHADGRRTNRRFPGLEISPHQPVSDIAGLEIAGPRNWVVHMDFEGAVFEMEDQRNWSDRSFKTYSTPLSEPYPILVKPGEVIEQRVRLRLEGSLDQPNHPVNTVPAHLTQEKLSRTTEEPPLLQFGTAWEPEDDQPLTQTELAALRSLKLTHLRVDWNPGNPAAFFAGLMAAKHLEVKPEIAIAFHRGLAEQLREVFREHAALMQNCRWLLTDAQTKSLSHPDLIRDFRSLLEDSGVPSSPIFVGTTSYFTELNRFRPPTGFCDGICYSINPQVHAFDEISIRETTDVLAPIAAAVDAIALGLPQAIGPITLRPRFNPNATESLQQDGTVDQDSVDARQVGFLNAYWTLLSILNLTYWSRQFEKSAAFTFHFARGPRGWLYGDSSFTVPGFPAQRGAVFDVYLVLRLLQDFEPESIEVIRFPDSLSMNILAKSGNVSRLLNLNFSEDSKEGYPKALGDSRRFWLIDSSSAPISEDNLEGRLRGNESNEINKQHQVNVEPFQIMITELETKES